MNKYLNEYENTMQPYKNMIRPVHKVHINLDDYIKTLKHDQNPSLIHSN